MKIKTLALVAAGVMSLGAALPSMAADGPLGSVASAAGSVTAVIVDTPEGIIWDSLWRCPHRTQRYLAEKFGDEKGFGQNLAGFVIGWPVGMVWGVPYGAVDGMVHGYKTGWEKPFSMESFNVTEEK
jgi:hypothetical protein